MKQVLFINNESLFSDEELDADATGGITAEIVKARDDDIIDESSLVKEVSHD